MDTINETTFLDLGIPANERQAEHAGDMAAAPWTLGVWGIRYGSGKSSQKGLHESTPSAKSEALNSMQNT